MNTKKPVTGAQAKTRIERASAASNHDKPGLRVKAGLKAGKLTANHSLGLRVKAGLKAGKLTANHSGRLIVRA